MKKLFLSIILIFSFNSNSFSNPLTFLDINWSMDEKTMINKLGEKGYNCEKNGPMYNCENQNSSSIIFGKNGDGNEMIQFDCKSFNACSFKMIQVAQSVADKYGIGLNGKKDSWGDLMYEGTGEDGDIIQISTKSDGPIVRIFKGSLGQKLNF